MKKAISAILAVAMCTALFAGCGSSETSSTESTTSEASTSTASTSSTASTEESTETAGTTASGPITVISREDGSGTRGAFIELMGVEEEDADGNKVDMTTVDAEISNSTETVIQSVAGNPSAIGYISLGSLDETVKAVKIDGAEATVENIKSGEYKVSRPFNVAMKADSTNEVAKDFLAYIMSQEGQAIVSEAGYINDDTAEPYAGSKPAGDVTVAGSSSVSPLMEKLIEGYKAVNPDANIELQTSDSTTGMTNTIDGVCDLGMASRELKQEELDAGLENTVIATDGIAIIVNNESPVEDLTSEQVKSIYVGEVTNWEDLA
jgi:phosphate transport system substrate-binding protein